MLTTYKQEYYTQVQGQLAVCKEYCEFICWMLRGMHVERIARNPDSVNPSLDKIFSDVLLPCLLREESLITVVLLPKCHTNWCRNHTN